MDWCLYCESEWEENRYHCCVHCGAHIDIAKVELLGRYYADPVYLYPNRMLKCGDNWKSAEWFARLMVECAMIRFGI